MKQLTKKQAIKMAKSEIWKDMTFDEIVKFQLFQKLLCMPFDKFHEAMEKVLGRPIFTHEFGLNYDGLVSEYLGNTPAPTFEDIMDMIPEDKKIIIIKV